MSDRMSSASGRLVEHLDVIAGVFLRGERVELTADRIDGLRNASAGPVPRHVLDEMATPPARAPVATRA
jgi:hypothetical protein